MNTMDATERDSARPRRTKSQPARTSSPKTIPKTLPTRSPSSTSKLPKLPRLNTQQQRGMQGRVPSYVHKRLSTLSNISAQYDRSRPQSTVFPMFHSSLPYSLVRDFAYPAHHPMHYGPPPEPTSTVSTPASEYQRRLSDPPPTTWAGARGQWSAAPGGDEGGLYGGPQLPATSYADGPPWSEDDDLHSPVVTSSKQRRTKSRDVNFDNYTITPRPDSSTRATFAGTNRDGTETYYISEEGELANGPGGEYITIAPDQGEAEPVWRRESRLRGGVSGRHYYPPELQHESDDDDEDDDEEHYGEPFVYDESRFSKDYQFTIASPDEEMHGKAVALFDFAREHENELPLLEGQILLVSYRHGQGWLVAQDPKSGETGLVPEDYVRLVRDIEGGLSSLTEQFLSDGSPIGESGTYFPEPEQERGSSRNGNGYRQARQSHFTTSSKDLEKYTFLNSPSTPTSKSPFRGSDGFGKNTDNESPIEEEGEYRPEPTATSQTR